VGNLSLGKAREGKDLEELPFNGSLLVHFEAIT